LRQDDALIPFQSRAVGVLKNFIPVVRSGVLAIGVMLSAFVAEQFVSAAFTLSHFMGESDSSPRDNEEPFSDMGASHCGSGYKLPFRIVPATGKVMQDC
jgi:hypothetical protein